MVRGVAGAWTRAKASARVRASPITRVGVVAGVGGAWGMRIWGRVVVVKLNVR
jgi:hypothetical protein